jgi:pimeloyl-ACP methyl ester carboxylesterase
MTRGTQQDQGADRSEGVGTARSELGRIAGDVRAAARSISGRDELPDATPADGDDPYGNPDPQWLRIDWRQHRRQVDVVGARANYVELGEGPPVVMVHGLSGAWQNWLEQVPHFARSHRVIAVDLPGFGGSPMPPWEISIPAYGRFLHDFCEKLGIGTCALVGHSMGGFIATELAIRDPARAQCLALVSAAGVTYARMRREPAEVAGRMGAAAAPVGFKFRMEGIKRARLRSLAFRGVFHDPNGLRRELLFENIVPALQSPGYLPAITTLVGYDIRDRLTEIEVPTLIVWGRHDRIVPVAGAFSYEKRIGENARRVIFDNCGHCPQMERPTRFNRLLESFLGER